MASDDNLNPMFSTVFLALAIWREARGASPTAQVGVAYSIINRVNKPRWWGNSLQTVLFKPDQYSSLTHPGDPQLTTWPMETDVTWADAVMVAQGVVAGRLKNPVGEADSYYDSSIPAPYWAKEIDFVIQIGNLRFYETAA